jgi:AraC family transcriptional regulator
MAAENRLEISTQSVITGSSEPILARRQQLDHTGHFRITGAHTSGISVATYKRDTAGMGLTLPTPVSDSYLNIVQLRSIGPTQFIRPSGESVRPNLEANGLQILDMRESWTVDIRQPFHSVDFFLAKSAISDFMREIGARGEPELIGCVANQTPDITMVDFARLMLPALEKPHEANALFIGHLFSAVRIHLIQRYGNCQVVTAKTCGKLAPWQERRVLETLRNDLAHDITIETLAAECGLSPTYFMRSFKATFGKAPHQWRLSHRIEKAKYMLEVTDAPISAIALACGFADQSHLTRVFAKWVGTAPAAWRRAIKAR